MFEINLHLLNFYAYVISAYKKWIKLIEQWKLVVSQDYENQ